MRIVWAVLSDYFIKDAMSGKDSVIGVFTHINVAGLPSPPISFWLTLQAEFHPGEHEEIHVKCDLIDEDGQMVHEVNLRMTPPGAPVDQGPHRPIIPMFVPNVVFGSAGLHRFDFHVEGQTLWELPVMVTLAHPPRPSG